MARIPKQLLQRIRIPLGFAFAAVFLFFARPTPLLILIGGFVGAAGLALRAWSSGYIQKNLALAVSGPYAFTRNPLYLGSFIMVLGLTISSGVWWLILVFVALFLGIYLPVMSVEAEELTEIFGEDFKEYSESVPLFFPRLRKVPKTAEKFELRLYLRYREYRALAGYAAILIVLVGKYYFLA